MGVSVTYLESVSKIWYVPANKLEPLNTMMEQLAAAASKSDLKLAENVEVDQVLKIYPHQHPQFLIALQPDKGDMSCKIP